MWGKNSNDCRGGEDCNDNHHMCRIAGRRDFEIVRDLVRDPRYVCRKCARTAHKDGNLCKPAELL